MVIFHSFWYVYQRVLFNCLMFLSSKRGIFDGHVCQNGHAAYDPSVETQAMKTAMVPTWEDPRH